MSKKRKTPSRNPSAPKTDPDIEETDRLLRRLVLHVKTMEDKISDQGLLYLKSAAVGYMFAMSELTGAPDPIDILVGDNQ